MASNKLTITLGFANNSDYTEEITFGNVADSVVPDVKDNIIAINESLAAETDDGLGAFFEDEDENPFVKIVAAKLVTEEVTLLT